MLGGIGGGGNFLGGIGSIVGGMFGGQIGSMIGQFAGQLVSSMLQSAIGSSNLPQQMQDVLDNVVRESFGQHTKPAQNQMFNNPLDAVADFFTQLGESLTGIGQALNATSELQQAIDALMDFIQSILLNEAGRDQGSGSANGAGGGGRGGQAGGGSQAGGAGESGGSSRPTEAGGGGGSRPASWLEAIAKALGEVLDKLAEEMEELSGKIGEENKPSDTAMFTAKSQEFSMLMNTASTALKTLGEGLSAQARKQ